MLEVGGRFPCCFVERVAEPLDEVLDLTTVGALGEDPFDLVLECVVDDLWRWWSWGPREHRAGGRVVVGLEHGDVEDWMKGGHGSRKIELVGDVADLGDDLEWTGASEVELLGGSGSLDVLRREEDLVADVEVEIRATLVGMFLLMSLSLDDPIMHVLVNGSKVVCKGD